MNDSNDFRFSGRGQLGGGEYGRLHFSGSGHIRGDATCTAIKTSGSFHSDGDILCSGEAESSGSFQCGGDFKAESYRSSGSAHIKQDMTIGTLASSGSLSLEGSVVGGDIHTSGSFRVKGGMQGGNLSVSGSASFEGSVKSEKTESSGSLQIGGDCEAERFASTGKVVIGGLLNAEDIQMKIAKSDCRIGEIGGERIEIRRSPYVWMLVPMVNGMLVTNSIEGDEIYLENTKAKIVRGKHVKIGCGCEIDEVEYSETFDCAVDAVVRASQKTGI